MIKACSSALLLLALCACFQAADAQFNTSNVICPPNLEKKTHRRRCYRDTLDAWNNLLLNEDLNENIQTAFGFLDKDAIFRADPIGVFEGAASVAEYISIFSSPAGPSNLIRPTEIVRRYFTSHGTIAHAAYDVTFFNLLNQLSANLTILQTCHFDAKSNRMNKADFNILRYPLFLKALQLYDALNPAIAEFAMFAPTCMVALNGCTGELQQYDDMASCMEFMRSVPTIDEQSMHSNSAACRFLHSPLVAFAPEVHCPHVGPTGGTFCVDIPYRQYYEVFGPSDFDPSK